jgi:hypothetical protein
MPFVTFTVRRGLSAADKSRLSEASRSIDESCSLRARDGESKLVSRFYPISR